MYNIDFASDTSDVTTSIYNIDFFIPMKVTRAIKILRNIDGIGYKIDSVRNRIIGYNNSGSYFLTNGVGMNGDIIININNNENQDFIDYIGDVVIALSCYGSVCVKRKINGVLSSAMLLSSTLIKYMEVSIGELLYIISIADFDRNSLFNEYIRAEYINRNRISISIPKSFDLTHDFIKSPYKESVRSNIMFMYCCMRGVYIEFDNVNVKHIDLSKQDSLYDPISGDPFHVFKK